MSRDSRKSSSFKTEDLLTILEKAKDIGNSNEDISTAEFIKAIKTQLMRAMTKPG